MFQLDSRVLRILWFIVVCLCILVLFFIVLDYDRLTKELYDAKVKEIHDVDGLKWDCSSGVCVIAEQKV